MENSGTSSRPHSHARSAWSQQTNDSGIFQIASKSSGVARIGTRFDTCKICTLRRELGLRSHKASVGEPLFANPVLFDFVLKRS